MRREHGSGTLTQRRPASGAAWTAVQLPLLRGRPALAHAALPRDDRVRTQTRSRETPHDRSRLAPRRRRRPRRNRPARPRPLRLEADRNRPPHHSGRARRHHRRDGPPARRASGDRVGRLHRGGEQVRRRRHHRDDRLRAAEAGRPHHHGRQSGAERDRLFDLPQPHLQARPVAAGQQHDPHLQHHLGASLAAGEDDRRADRPPEGEPGLGELRDLRHRAEPASHRRLVPAAHRAEDDACAVPRRRPRDHRSARRTGADLVRQPVSHLAAGARRQADRARHHDAGAHQPDDGHPDHARERA